MSVREIAATNSKHLWQTVSGACTTANVWVALSTFGAQTVTAGGKLARPSWANSISGLIITMVHDHSATGGGISGLRLRSGINPNPQYFLSSVWGGQTTVSVGAVSPPLLLSPSLEAAADVGIDATPGVTASGVGTSTCSIRWDAAKPATKLYWQAAEVNTTAATDTLSDAIIALAGDTTFPLNAPGHIRALAIAQASDLAAAGQTIGQYRIQGTGLKDNPQDLAGQGQGSEGGATSGVAGGVAYWDEWLECNVGSQISLLGGYTGADSGTETLGVGIAFQV